jgi:type VI secretion system secreted protein Hcp
MPAVDFFLKIDGIEGESKDEKHAKEIELDAWSWSERQSNNEDEAGSLARVHMDDFSFVMKVCKASPKLLLACASGEHYKSAVLTCRNAGGEQQEYMTITFKDVMVTSFRTSATSNNPQDSYPRDHITLNFAIIEYSYKEQKSDGTLGAATKAGWNLQTNRKA